MTRFDLAAAVSPIVTRAIADRVFPGAAIEVGRANGPLAAFSAGTLTYEPGSPAVDATNDLRSRVADQGHRRRSRSWPARCRAAACASTIASVTGSMHGPEKNGRASRFAICSSMRRACRRIGKYFESRQGRASFEIAICEEPLDYPPRTKSLYSDPGFMLLGFAIENAAGEPLDRQFDHWRDRELGADVELRFRPRPAVDRSHRADREHAARR